MKRTSIAALAGAAAVLLLLVQGCANYQSISSFDHTGSAIVRDVNYPIFPVTNQNQVTFDMDATKFQVLGVVTSRTESENILGVVSKGGGGLSELIQEARNMGADDVINLKADTYRKSIGLPVPFSSLLFSASGLTFYTKSELTLIGTAIKYNK
ncbi:MAG: hypothetical protein Kow0059_15350 [Candidatus Sumerlaeia bacterium]